MGIFVAECVNQDFRGVGVVFIILLSPEDDSSIINFNERRRSADCTPPRYTSPFKQLVISSLVTLICSV